MDSLQNRKHTYMYIVIQHMSGGTASTLHIEMVTDVSVYHVVHDLRYFSLDPDILFPLLSGLGGFFLS